MENNQPYQTNQNKKIVFIFSVFASAFFNVLLFSSIGENLPIQIVWSLIGIAAVFFQTVKLREFFNSKKKIRYLHLSFYIVCTIGSIAGTLGAGYSHIEKTKLGNIDNISQLEIIDKKIQDIENNTNDNTSIAISQMMLDTNINQWAFLAMQKILKEKSLNKTVSYSNYITLKSNRAMLLKEQSGIISSLSGLSHILRISEEMTAFVFLIFVALILEMMVFGSATFTGTLLIKIKFKPKPSKPLKLIKPITQKIKKQKMF